MKFKTLQKLANKCRVELGEYVSIHVEHSVHSEPETLYTFYSESGGNSYFKTAQELKAYMEEILNPAADEGVEV